MAKSCLIALRKKKMQTCRICKEEKNVDEFVISQTTPIKVHRKDICKSCGSNKTMVVYYLKKKHPYPDDSYACPICLRPSHKYYLDHDWNTQEFRGWLCNKCNSGLGALNDDIETLMRAADYLRERKGKVE